MDNIQTAISAGASLATPKFVEEHPYALIPENCTVHDL